MQRRNPPIHPRSIYARNEYGGHTRRPGVTLVVVGFFGPCRLGGAVSFRFYYYYCCAARGLKRKMGRYLKRPSRDRTRKIVRPAKWFGTTELENWLTVSNVAAANRQFSNIFCPRHRAIGSYSPRCCTSACLTDRALLLFNRRYGPPG